METLKIKTPMGNYVLMEHEGFITSCQKGSQGSKTTQSRVLKTAQKQLSEYFEGKRLKFDLPLKPEGTSFQKQVWEALQKIPYGKTWCYQDLANKIKKP